MKNLNAETIAQFQSTILNNRFDKDSKTGAKYITLHSMQVLENHGISAENFIKLNVTPEKDGFMVAQKSFKRAMYLLNAIANNAYSSDFIPFEITSSLINYAAFEGKISGELANAFLSRLIELSEESQARAGNKMKLKTRDTKKPTTASAQSSSIKGMLRAFGAMTSAKNAREVEANINHPLLVTALNGIKTTLKSDYRTAK